MRGTQTWPPAAARAATPAPATTTGPAMGDGSHGNAPELVGYARVSVRSQHDDTQITDLTAAGCVRIFADKGVSGKLASRPELDKAVAYLRPGDTFVITRLSRAMRSLRHLLDLVHDLDERGIGLVVLKQSIDTTTSTGRLVFHILGAIDEWMRELIVEGTLEGLEAARAKGHKGGQRPALDPEQEELAVAAVQNGTPIAEVARSFRVSRAAIYRAGRRHGIEPPAPGGASGRPATPPETTAEILRLLRAGQSVTAVAEAAGVSRTTVRGVWRKAGERQPPPGAGNTRAGRLAGGQPRKLSPDKARLAAQLLAAGESVTAVAKLTGVSRETVKRAVRDLEQAQSG